MRFVRSLTYGPSDAEVGVWCIRSRDFSGLPSLHPVGSGEATLAALRSVATAFCTYPDGDIFAAASREVVAALFIEEL